MVIADLLAVSGRSWRADQSRRAPRIESDPTRPAPGIEVHVHSDAADWPVRAAHSLRDGPASSQALRARPPNARTLPALRSPHRWARPLRRRRRRANAALMPAPHRIARPAHRSEPAACTLLTPPSARAQVPVSRNAGSAMRGARCGERVAECVGMVKREERRHTPSKNSHHMSTSSSGGRCHRLRTRLWDQIASAPRISSPHQLPASAPRIRPPSGPLCAPHDCRVSYTRGVCMIAECVRIHRRTLRGRAACE